MGTRRGLDDREPGASVLNAADGRIGSASTRATSISSCELARLPSRSACSSMDEPPGDAHGLDADEQGRGTLVEPRLYQLIRQPGSIVDRTFEIAFDAPGVEAYAFTFG